MVSTKGVEPYVINGVAPVERMLKLKVAVPDPVPFAAVMA